MITSRQNPLIKKARSLRRTKARRESGLFLIEGLFHLGEALAAHWPLDTLLYAPDLLTSDFGHEVVETCRAQKIPVRAVAADLFASLTEKQHPQGLLAIARQRQEVWQPATTAPRRSVALVSPQDPGNVGTILRTLDAVGADALFLLDGGVDRFHPSLLRASMGAFFWHPVYVLPRDEFWRWVEIQRAWVLGASAHARLDWRLADLPPEPLHVLMLGSEQKGLAPEDLAACALNLALPMRGRVTSLNLAVAAGVLMYALWG